jgi:hypothetical protein
MATGATGQLGLALPVQGELSGTWGDTVNNGITQYTNIAIAATLTLTNDGAVTLANTTGDASASNITSTLTGAGTVTAQFAIVRITGTLTTAKVVTAPSYSKTYVVVNAATGSTVTFKASGQTGVSIAVGESAYVYYNGTDYVKISSSASGSYPAAGIAVSTGSAWTTSLTAPSGTVVGTTDTQTLTNKRIDPRVTSAASASSLTPDISAADQYAYTALAANLTINAPTGTPVNGNKLIFRLLDNGTARTLTWNATYTVIGVTLPTTTVINKTTYVGCIYNANNTRWDVIAVITQA